MSQAIRSKLIQKYDRDEERLKVPMGTLEYRPSIDCFEWPHESGSRRPTAIAANPCS